MTAKTFQTAITCPACKNTGTAKWEETSKAERESLRKLVGLPEGFSSRDVGPHYPVQIFCSSCKAAAVICD